MMVRGHRVILATIAAAALITTASACEGNPPTAPVPTPSVRPSVNPLKSLTSYKIIDKAFANTEAASSVQITGAITRAGETTRLSSLSLVNGGGGCLGDVYQFGVGTFQLIDDGTSVWVLPSLDYWQQTDLVPTPDRPAVVGKYLQLTPGARGLGALAGLCSLPALAGTGPSPARTTGFGAPTPVTVGRLPALKITDTADGGYATVSETAKPRLLSFYVPGQDGGSLTFTYFGTPVTLTAPPATEVVDGSQYGL